MESYYFDAAYQHTKTYTNYRHVKLERTNIILKISQPYL